MNGRDADLTGGWCWFQAPRVLATRDATFVGWTEYDERGTISVARFDHEERTFTVARGVGETPALAPDDHNAPALYVRRDGRLVVFYTAHNRPDGNRYRIAAEPARIAEFGPERTIPDVEESTYPMPVRVAPDGPLLYVYRDSPADGSPSTFYYYESTDDGETWSDRRRLFAIDGDDYSGYVTVDGGGGRVDVCFSRHPRSAPLERCDVRHFYYDGGERQFRDSHGAPLETPIRESEMTRLFDADARGERGWIWDVAAQGDEPAVAFASFADGDERDQRHHYARYVDGSWTVTEVAETDHLHATNTAGAANEREYAPGISLGHAAGDDAIYLSRGDGGREDRRRGLRVEEWRVANGGESVRRERVVASGAASNQFRPATPRTVGPEPVDTPIRAVWMCNQSRAPYHYHDPTETVALRAEIEVGDGTETVRMDEWRDYDGRSG